MSRLKIVSADGSKIHRGNQAKTPDRVYLVALAAAIGIALLIAFCYTISNLAQAMAAADLSSRYS